MLTVPADVEAARATRWRHDRPPLKTRARAAAFVDDIGFSLLFPARGVALPSLYEAASERAAGGGEPLVEWGPEAERIWAWKDELPRRGLAWYGKFVRGRASLLAPSLLADLYPRSGEPDDFREAPLGSDARRIAEIVLLSGPTSTALLREALDAFGPKGRARFDRAILELGRGLVTTHYGVEEQGAGWPAAVLELTARAFEVGGSRRAADALAARIRVAERFLDTMILARPYELGNAFGIGATAAREAFEQLVSLGTARRFGPGYRLAT